MAIGDPAPHMMVIGAHAAPSAPQEINDNPFVWRAALRRGFGVGHIDR